MVAKCMIAVAILWLCPIVNAQEKTEPGGEALDGTEAVAIHQSPPIYPRKAQVAYVEGWVIVGFSVTPEGKTENTSILESSIEGYFEKAALKAVESWEYRPATINGEATTQARNTAILKFMMEDSDGGVSKSFYSRYRKAYAALQKEDLGEAQEYIDDLVERDSRLFAEICYLDYIQGLYEYMGGDTENALVHFNRALKIADEAVPDGTHAKILRLTIPLNLDNKRYLDLLDNYSALVKVDPDMSPDDPLHEVAAKVKQFLAGSSPYVLTGKIKQPCHTCEATVPVWYHTLARDRFTLQRVNGQITDLRLLCGFKFVALDYETDTEWSINRDWGKCTLEVHGSEGTSFELVEL